MARFEDSLYPFGSDVNGSETYGNIKCDWCGREYTGREDKFGNNITDDAIGFYQFGNLQVCDCCFENLEYVVLSRMDDIIPWFIRILKKRKVILERQEGMIAKLRQTLKEFD